VVEKVIALTRCGARFSRCRRWRYLLWRKWAEGPVVNFLMLNPSTADEVKLDPSCTRARLYAERWGFGALIVTNLFGWRATDPDDMKAARDPVGTGNDLAIISAAMSSKLVICAWGNHGAYRERSKKVVELLKRKEVSLHALRLNRSGEPAHPLYLPGALGAAPWRWGRAPKKGPRTDVAVAGPGGDPIMG
jgi:hypothetical protein